jgi:hypothetical protein
MLPTRWLQVPAGEMRMFRPCLLCSNGSPRKRHLTVGERASRMGGPRSRYKITSRVASISAFPTSTVPNRYHTNTGAVFVQSRAILERNWHADESKEKEKRTDMANKIPSPKRLVKVNCSIQLVRKPPWYMLTTTSPEHPTLLAVPSECPHAFPVKVPRCLPLPCS